MTRNQFIFLQRLSGNNFNSGTPARVVNSTIKAGWVKPLDRYYYELTEAGIRAVCEAEEKGEG